MEDVDILIAETEEDRSGLATHRSGGSRWLTYASLAIAACAAILLAVVLLTRSDGPAEERASEAESARVSDPPPERLGADLPDG